MVRTAIITAILASVISGGCDSDIATQNDGQEIIALERSALDKWAQSNTSGYISISADDITWFDFLPGQQSRVDSLQAVSKYLEALEDILQPHTYEMVKPKVQIYGNTAILTFHWFGSMTDGTPLGGWKTTSVYTMKDGKWRQVHAHWSTVESE
ncbi:MAG: nuclear transport factor 2 family protein [Bacteroidales bacterium]|nr:nuclear transport factor 2 family protein [Bacteroidales bacterium]